MNNRQFNLLFKEYEDCLYHLFKTHNKQDIKKTIKKVIKSKMIYNNYVLFEDKGINLDHIDFNKLKYILIDRTDIL